MKRLLFISLSLLPVLSLFSQNGGNTCLNKDKYLEAFNYIEVDSINRNKTILVIDSIADLDLHWFLEDLNKLRGEDKTIQDYFKFEWEENRHSPLLASLFSKKIICRIKY